MGRSLQEISHRVRSEKSFREKASSGACVEEVGYVARASRAFYVEISISRAAPLVVSSPRVMPMFTKKNNRRLKNRV